jgi:hypothetical protein
MLQKKGRGDREGWPRVNSEQWRRNLESPLTAASSDIPYLTHFKIVAVMMIL